MPIAPFRESRLPVSVARGEGEPAPPSAQASADGPSTKGASAFAQLLVALGAEANRGEAVMKGAMAASRGGAGRDLGPGELLALQAGVYRYSETVDLASKLVDRATSGVKTVVQGQ